MNFNFFKLKNKILSFIVAFGVFALLFAGNSLSVRAEEGAFSKTTMYRLQINNGSRYFFTDNPLERDTLVSMGWKSDGIGWEYPKGVAGQWIYRLVSNGGYHFFTDDPNERDVLASSGWSYEGEAFLSPYEGTVERVPIYRVVSPGGFHLFTANETERDNKVRSGWTYEGICWYGVKSETTVTSNPVVMPQTPTLNPNFKASTPDYMKGVWISFLEWQDYLKGKNEADFRQNFEKMCDNSLANNCNTIFVHVRSHNDAVYPSEIYPWSTEMLEGIPSFNPLTVMIEIAHKKGLSFHAWINPYGFRNGQIAGNAALATKDNIISGIKEIVSNYEVDGIHFDDYFPDADKAEHNQMVREAYEITHAYGRIFGISPQGNLSNNRAKGVDIDTWLSVPGYVDYLAPQIYWSDQYGKDGSVTMFSDRLNAWTEINKLNLPMYVGLATYRTGSSIAGDSGWVLTDNNLATQIQKANAAGWKGYIHFRYAHLLAESSQRELSQIK